MTHRRKKPKIKFRITNQLEKSQLHFSDSPNLSNDSHTSTSDSITDNKGMDNSSTGLVTAARAGVKTGLVVYLARLEQQKLFILIGLLLGPVTKR